MASIFDKFDLVLDKALDHAEPHLNNNRRLREENIALKQKLEEGRQNIKTLAQKLNAATADASRSVESVAQYGTLQNELNKCRAERDDTKQSLKAALEEKAEAKTTIEKLQKQIQDIEEASRAHQNDNEERIEALKNMLQSVSDQVSKANSEKRGVELQLSQTQKQVAAMDQQSTGMKKQKDLLEKDFRALANDNDQLSKNISSLQITIQKKDENQKKLETKIAELTQDKQNLQRELQKAKDEYQQLNQTRQSLVMTVAKRDKTIDLQRSLIQNLETTTAHGSVELKRSKHELLMISQAHDMALSDISQLKMSLKNTQKSMAEKEKEAQVKREDLEKRLTDLCVQRGSLENKLKLTNEKLEASHEEVAALNIVIKEREHTIEEEKEKLASLGGPEKVKVLSQGGKIMVSESHF